MSARYRLPVFATIGRAYGTLWARRACWARPAAATLVIALIVEAGQATGSLPELRTAAGDGRRMLTLALIIAATVYVLYAVVLTRVLAAPPDDLRGGGWLIPHRRHGRFILRALVLLAIVAVGALVAATLLPAIGTTAGISGTLDGAGGQAAFTVMALLVFAAPTALLAAVILPSLPAAAVDDHAIGIGRAIELSHGNLWRSTLAVGFGALLPFWLLDTATAYATASVASTVAAGLAGVVLDFAGLTAAIALAAAIYRRLRDNVDLSGQDKF